ncbi:MAG: MarR family transcriptional regulator [Gemmatimonadota bacterium]|jgi:DNA-binding MarR family transcriptional regulator|nr:MarR family transcriptional regulator [Gemmatimonadota bacterium]
MKNEADGNDAVDEILRQWSVERPDLDVSAMGVFGRLSRAARMLGRSLAQTFGRYGLNGGEFDVLATLRRAGGPYGLTPTDLYRSMMLSSAAMTNRIDRLEERGLVAREPDPDDRRGVRIRLTNEGFELIDGAVTAHVEGEERLLAALSEEERQHLAELLGKLMLSMQARQQTETHIADS